MSPSVDAGLLAAQRAYFAALDPALPVPPSPAIGTAIDAATPSGIQVTGVLHRERHTEGTVELLWSAEDVWQLHPYPGDTGEEGLDALLRAWRGWMARQPTGPDSACVVFWPSRDAQVVRVFLDHGFVARSALAIREPQPSAADVPAGVRVRRAGSDDFGAALRLAVIATGYAASVGGRARPDPATLLTPDLRAALDGGLVWLAERHGRAAGLIESAWVEVRPGSPANELLPSGRWGYLNNVGTEPASRGIGIGRALAAEVHDWFAHAGATGTYLYYNPPNPLASVFWHRLGYRPLWTIWEAAPASAFR